MEMAIDMAAVSLQQDLISCIFLVLACLVGQCPSVLWDCTSYYAIDLFPISPFTLRWQDYQSHSTNQMLVIFSAMAV